MNEWSYLFQINSYQRMPVYSIDSINCRLIDKYLVPGEINNHMSSNILYGFISKNYVSQLPF